MAEPTSMLDAALALAGRGWRVLPVHGLRDGTCTCKEGAECPSAGKHPALKGWPELATTTPAAVRGWFSRGPRNVGIATGAGSGIIVLDVDGEEGRASLRHLEAEYGKLPETVQVLTGGGGLHVYLEHPGWPVSNRGRTGEKEFLPGVHVRGDGGQVVAPPSLHASGRRYEFEATGDPADGVTVAPAPEWLLMMLKPEEKPPATSTPVSASCTTPYGRRALDAEAAALAAMAPDTGRNNKLNDAAFAAGQLVAGGELDEAEARAALLAAADACGLKRSESEPTLESGLTAGKGKPRTAPERDRQPNTLRASVATATDTTKTAAPPTSWRLTEMGNAERFAAMNRDRLRWCGDMGKWLVWTGRNWRPDETGEAVRMAKATVLGMYAEAGQIEDDKAREAFTRFVNSAAREHGITAMMNLAKSELPLPVRAADLDADGWLFNCENGTLDLRTGELRPHRPDDLCTKLAPATFDPQAEAPTWAAFLDRIMAGNRDLQDFLQRAVGASLPAHTREQVMFVLYGMGANGKTTFAETLMALWGAYARTCASSTLMARREDTGVRNDLADLCGARLVATSETAQGRRLDENLVKQLTGGDRITARFLFREFFEFTPGFRVWLRTNHKPEIRGTDLAIWRRIRLIPFNVTIPEPEQDRELGEKLLAELPGILNWCLAGCMAWQASGIGAPEEVTRATADYRAESDVLAQFLEACCVLAPEAVVKTGDLRDAYLAWCGDEREKPLTSRAFADRLKERGPTTDQGSRGVRIWRGIGLLAND